MRPRPSAEPVMKTRAMLFSRRYACLGMQDALRRLALSKRDGQIASLEWPTTSRCLPAGL